MKTPKTLIVKISEAVYQVYLKSMSGVGEHLILC